MKTRAPHSLVLTTYVVTCLLLHSCFQSKPQLIAVNPLIAKYVSGYTSGMISNSQRIRIELAQPYTSPSFLTDSLAKSAHTDVGMMPPLPDSTLLENIFSFEPAMKGHAIWINNRTIEFIPAAVLPSNQLYTVSFRLKKLLMPEEDAFKTFVFQFSSAPQNLALSSVNLSPYDDGNPHWLRLSGDINSSDLSDTTTIMKTVHVYVNNKEATLSWEQGYDGKSCRFFADSIQRTDLAGKVIIRLDGSSMGSTSNEQKELKIAAISDFSVSSVEVTNRDEQVIEMYFSDPLWPNQNLAGLVSVEGCDNPQVSVDGNKLTIFHDAHLVGYKTIRISGAVKNFRGYAMSKTYTDSLSFYEHGPQVKIEGNGCILPNSAGLIFPFEAIGLSAVDVRVIKIFGNNVQQFLQVNDLNGNDGLTRVGKIVVQEKIMLNTDKHRDLKQWNTHVLNLNKLILPDPGAIYRISITFNKAYALCDCSDDGDEAGNAHTGGQTELDAAAGDDAAWNENDWHSYGFGQEAYEEWGYYNDNNQNYCDDEYYYGKAVSRNIIASDIGMIYKLDEKKRSYAFVSNMLSTEPLARCTIEYFDYTRQLIARGVSDENGMLDLQLTAKPFLMIASYGRQRGYLKLLDGNVNTLSKFDIDGEVVQKGVKGYIYGDRGVWRPGDSLYLCFMLSDKEHRLPAHHPVLLELQNPEGQVIYRQSKTLNVNGLYDFRTVTSPDAVTGNYTAVARVGNRAFSQALKIEMVKPNRLKIAFEPYTSKTPGSTDTLAVIQARWLHGTPARELHATVKANLNPVKASFEKFPGYEFDSPLRFSSTTAYTVFDNELDEQGKAWLTTGFPVGGTAPAKMRASFITMVFEAGGDFSVDRAYRYHYPYQNYIGLKTPQSVSSGKALQSGMSYRFELASTDRYGNSISLDKVQLKIYKLEWRWWYEHDEEDLNSFIARPGTLIVKDTLTKTIKGKGWFTFSMPAHEYSRYLVTVTDVDGGHQAGTIVFADQPGMNRQSRGNTENAAMLNFSTSKPQYTAGEDIVLSFPSPAKGKALVSIETGTRVLKKFWVTTQQGETQCRFTATADMCPNAYIHLTLLQPHANTLNDLPIRMYGLVPVMVDDPLSHLNPVIITGDVWKPESKGMITVKEQHGLPMTYTLAVVDEGLLDLTRFKTPQPWNTFYAREAHGIKTWDMYDAVIGAYAGKLQGMVSIGGDGDGLAGRGVKANRFKPMVKFIGPFTLQAGQHAIHQVDIPNYVGSVRVMLVGRNNEAYGSAEQAVAIRKPLMVLATLPRVLGPGEMVYLPVDVFAMEPQVRDVKVEIEVNDLLSIAGAKTQHVHFDKPGDAVLNFKLNVTASTGVAKVRAIATCGGQRAVQEIEIDIRNPNPKVIDADEYELKPGAHIDHAVLFNGLKGSNKVSVEVSSVPPLGLNRRIEELIQYPHGCIEQTTSGLFPQLFVGNLIDLDAKQLERADKFIKAGLKRLTTFQTAAGGFAYWPGEDAASEWGTNYAGHFMLEAEKQGYTLPWQMKEHWIKFQAEKARNWDYSDGLYTHAHGNETYQQIQAYRLFVLALANVPETGSMNRLREDRQLMPAARWRLAAAYALIGQTAVALQLISDLATTVPDYRELSYGYGSELRDEAMILETLAMLKDKSADCRSKAAALSTRIATSLNSGAWMSTQEAAYSLLAVCGYAGAINNNRPMLFNVAINNTANTAHSISKKVCSLTYTEQQLAGNAHINISNTGSQVLYVKVLTAGVPLIGDKRATARNIKMFVRYLDVSGDEIHPAKIIQGTDFVAEVMLINPGTRGMLKEMALNQVFAAGWEIHNGRMDDVVESGSRPRYRDIRDDRIYTYYDAAPRDTLRFTARLNATYLGKFYLPTVYTEAMYDNSIHARVPGMWVEVISDPAGMAIR